MLTFSTSLEVNPPSPSFFRLFVRSFTRKWYLAFDFSHRLIYKKTVSIEVDLLDDLATYELKHNHTGVLLFYLPTGLKRNFDLLSLCLEDA